MFFKALKEFLKIVFMENKIVFIAMIMSVIFTTLILSIPIRIVLDTLIILVFVGTILIICLKLYEFVTTVKEKWNQAKKRADGVE